MVERAGGQGISMQVDHLDPAQVQALVARIESEQSRLDILVNDVWGRGVIGRMERTSVEALPCRGTTYAEARNRYAYHHQPLRTTNLDQESGGPGCRDD
ncbi:MAG: hypothetical protein WBP88_13815 [Nitrososphaeraceae archaeon]